MRVAISDIFEWLFEGIGHWLMDGPKKGFWGVIRRILILAVSLALILLIMIEFWPKEAEASDDCLPTKEPIPVYVHEVGYKDAKGQWLFKIRGIGRSFSEYGYAYVDGNFVNTKGEAILKAFIFDNGPDDVKEGLMRFQENEKIGFANQCMEKIIEAKYDSAWPFYDGLAKVCIDCKQVCENSDCEHPFTKGGRWGAINREGEEVVPIAYKDSEIDIVLKITRERR